MSAKAELRKHGADAEKALMKEFMQLMDMDVMDPQKADEFTAQDEAGGDSDDGSQDGDVPDVEALASAVEGRLALAGSREPCAPASGDG